MNKPNRGATVCVNIWCKNSAERGESECPECRKMSEEKKRRKSQAYN